MAPIATRIIVFTYFLSPRADIMPLRDPGAVPGVANYRQRTCSLCRLLSGRITVDFSDSVSRFQLCGISVADICV